MKNTPGKILAALLVAASIASSATGAETAARPTDLKSAVAGDQAPRFADGGLVFTANASSGTSASLPEKFDFSNGVRFDFEYKIGENRQPTPYSRLLDCGILSIHFDGDNGRKIKFLYAPKHVNIAQAIGIAEIKPDQWRRVSAGFDIANGLLSLKVDDGAPVHTAFRPSKEQLTDITLLLGAERTNAPARGLAGSIRNLCVTTPFRLAPHDARAAVAPGTAPTVNGQPVIHRRVAATPGRHYAFPGIARLADGRLAAVFREGDSHVCPFGKIMIAFSADDGASWSVPRVAFDSPNDDRDPALLRLPDGTLVLSTFRHGVWMKSPEYAAAADYARKGFDGDMEKFENALLFSRDNGRSWSEPVAVPAFTPHGPIVFDGKLLHAFAEYGTPHRVNIYEGNPDGGAWRKIGVAAESNYAELPLDEPNLLALANGELLCAIRSHKDGFMRLTRSTDGGRTWSGLEKTPVRGYPQHLLQLADGRILAVYGYRYPPMGIRGCVSRDNGKTWDIDREFIIRGNADGGDIGYPQSLELADGRVMTIYYFSDTGNWKPFIETAVYRP